MKELFLELSNNMNSEPLEKLKEDVEAATKELPGEKLSRVLLYGEPDIDFALISNFECRKISRKG